jgi:hypothetical protein
MLLLIYDRYQLLKVFPPTLTAARRESLRQVRRNDERGREVQNAECRGMNEEQRASHHS